MKKYILFFIGALIGLNIFFSCAEDENDKDKDSPKILDIKVNWGDTISYNGVVDTVNAPKYRQNSTAPDTIITGRKVNFSARFQDDRGLSTYMIKIYSRDNLIPDIDSDFTACQRLYYHDYSSMGEQKDTVLCMIDTWSRDVFNQRDTVVSQNDMIILAKYPKTVRTATEGLVTKQVPVRPGNYRFDVYCVDKSGKQTREKRNVFIVSRDSFIIKYR